MVAKSTLLKGVHAHGCPRCKTRFEDYCSVPWEDTLCIACRTGKPAGWQELIENRRPKDCCRVHSRPVTKQEAETFRLGSTCAWFICRMCARTHPFKDPTRENHG